MRVFYRSLRRALTAYEQTDVSFCCSGMARQWGKLLDFGVRGESASTNRGVSLFVDRPQANGRMLLELVPIQHCPFCGEAIETALWKDEEQEEPSGERMILSIERSC